MDTAAKTKKIWIPESTAELFLRAAGLALFGFRYFKEVFTPPFEIKETLRQCFSIGYKSLSLISITFLDHNSNSLDRLETQSPLY